MIFGSVCSGIEAASVAWHPLGWRAAFVSEIENFPRAVLRQRWPDVPLHGDFTTIGEDDYGPIDLLVGGTPCQSFSVAGLRQGMDDPRGGLALEFLKLARRKRPRWVVWENVPGVFSIDGGRAFAAIVGGLVELGYGCVWRVLDAQYVRVDGFPFAVPQRRRRVFVVGHSGDAWQRAAAVLLEPESLSGNPPPRRQAGQGIAADVAPGLVASGRGVERTGESRGQDAVIAQPVANPLTARMHKGVNSTMDEGQTMVAHALRAGGFDASEDGTGRGTPVIAFQSNESFHSGRNFDVAPTVKIGSNGQGNPPAVAFSCKDHGADAGETAPTLRAMGHDGSHPNAGGQVAVAFPLDLRNATRDPEKRDEQNRQGCGVGNAGDPAHTLTKEATHGVAFGMAVRRLTPRECERLQGFPDDYTLVEYRGKPAADGPRYKALGNSMAVNVMRWLGARIDAVDAAGQFIKEACHG